MRRVIGTYLFKVYLQVTSTNEKKNIYFEPFGEIIIFSLKKFFNDKDVIRSNEKLRPI